MLARRTVLSALAVLLLSSPALSQPVPIPVPNYDFSDPYVANFPPYAVPGTSDWVQSPQPAWWTTGNGPWQDAVGTFVNVPSEWIDNLVPSGGTSVHQQAAFMFSDPGLQLSQTLSSTFQVGEAYQLAVSIEGGGQGMPPGTPMEIGLYYLDSSGTQATQVMVRTTTVLNDLALSGSPGSYISHLPDRYLAIPAVAAGDPWAGQNIGIALIQPNSGTTGGYWDVDNVRLTNALPAIWTGASGTATWSNSSNWTNGVPNYAAATAVINAPAASPITVTLDGPQTVGTLSLGASNGASVTISGTGGNTLTLNDLGSGATIFALSGSHEIDAPVVLAENLTVSGSGTLTFGASSSITDNGSQYSLTMSGTDGTLILSGSNNYNGGTNVYAGTLIVASPTGLLDGSALTVGTSGEFAAPIQGLPIPGSLDAQSDGVVSAVPEPGTFVLLAVSAVIALVVMPNRLKKLPASGV